MLCWWVKWGGSVLSKEEQEITNVGNLYLGIGGYLRTGLNLHQFGTKWIVWVLLQYNICRIETEICLTINKSHFIQTRTTVLNTPPRFLLRGFFTVLPYNSSPWFLILCVTSAFKESPKDGQKHCVQIWTHGSARATSLLHRVTSASFPKKVLLSFWTGFLPPTPPNPSQTLDLHSSGALGAVQYFASALCVCSQLSQRAGDTVPKQPPWRPSRRRCRCWSWTRRMPSTGRSRPRLNRKLQRTGVSRYGERERWCSTCVGGTFGVSSSIIPWWHFSKKFFCCVTVAL